MKKSKYKELIFRSEAGLNRWLLKMTHQIVDFKDLGQDMSRMWIHETGEILHCDFHSKLYSGRFIEREKVEVGKPINIWDNENSRYDTYQNLVVEEIKPSVK